MTEDSLQILIVDDDMMARMMAAQCVKKQGHIAVMAEGGVQALEQLQSSVYDLVLLDLLMPGMDGFEVLSSIQRDPNMQKIPVIMVTGSEEADSLAKCIDMGAAGHLSKPIDSEQLATQIDRVCDRA